MPQRFFVSAILLILPFAVAVFLFSFVSSADAAQLLPCSDRVLFPKQGIERFYRSAVFDTWSEWMPRQKDWNTEGSLELWGFSQNCFAAGFGTMQLAFEGEFSSSLDLLFRAVVHASVDADGYIFEDEAHAILGAGDLIPQVLPRMEKLSRLRQYVEEMQPQYGTFFINKEAPLQFGVLKGADFSGSVLQFGAKEDENIATAPDIFLLYDFRTGYMQYELPLDRSWNTFPEVTKVVEQYSEAARSVSGDCRLEFTGDDRIRGILLPSGTWHLRVTSSLQECPPVFSVTLSASQRQGYGIDEIPAFGSYEIRPHTPLMRIFPHGILTYKNLHVLATVYLPGFLGILIMVCAGVLFGALMIHTVVHGQDPRSFFRQKK